ncbi:hypothetical protein E4U03_04625 [Rothia nasimurium]|uniref:Uncharacterized protein n=1 Tax=Rothia nasimurium TaxID=85336 RepID=A0A4Y9F4J6_9MICC|nr:hypothetical protein [Rothia nasimurium]MBF0807903.1 hypothetical protein [Rothia nasimurium]TFU22904.1 hypothetical protein E4U03_04625 [Rothia nasimurium]
MANLNLVGAVAVKVRPDADGFRSETRRKVMQELRGVEGQVPVTPEVARGSQGKVRAQVQGIARSAETTVDMRLRLSDAQVRRDLSRVAREIDRFQNTVVKLGADTEQADAAINAHRDRVDELTRKYNNLGRVKLSDLTRAQNALERSQKSLAEQSQKLLEAQEKLSAATAAYSENNSKKNERALKRATAAVQEQAKAVEELKAAHEQHHAQVRKSARAQENLQRNMGALVEQEQHSLASAERVYARKTKILEEQFELAQAMHTINVGSAEQVRGLLVSQRREQESISQTLDRILRQAKELDNAQYAGLRQWAAEDFARDKVARLRVEADTALAESQLIALERTRTVRIFARLDHSLTRVQSLLQSGGALDKDIDHISSKYRDMFVLGARSMGALGFIGRFTDAMSLSAQNMDKLATGSGKLLTVLTAGVGALTAGAGGLAAMTRDVVALGKGVLILPAALGAVGTAAAVSTRGVKEFTGALTGDTEALREINALAADTAEALAEMFKAADRSGKQRFFTQVQGELARMSETTAPIADYWEDAYEAQGRFFSGALAGLNAWHDSGDMSLSLENARLGLENATGAAQPFTQSLLDIAAVGSTHLPYLGGQLTILANKWANFIRVSKENGNLDAWLRRAGEEATYLGGALKHTWGIFSAVGQAAETAGYGGLEAFALGAERIDTTMHSDLWQGGMADIFRGAKDGAKSSADGFGILMDSIIRTSGYWEDYGRTTGDTVGIILGHMGKLLTGSSALEGTGQFMHDINQAARESGPLFVNMGNAYGQAASTAGQLALAGQKIADAFFRAWGDMGTLTDGMNAAIPVLADFAVEALDIAHVFTGILAEGLGQGLKWFAELPGPVQGTALAIGATAFALGKLRSAGGGSVIAGLGAQFPLLGSAAGLASGKVRAFGDGWKHMSGLVRNGASFETATGHLHLMNREFGPIGRNAGQAALGLAQIRGAMNGTNYDGAAGAAGRFSTALTGVKNVGVSGLRGALGGLTNFLGGPWGVAFAVAGAAVGIWAAEVAEAKQHTQALQGSLDEAGNVTMQTAEQLTRGFENYGTAVGNWFDKANEWTMNLLPGTEQIWTFEGAVKATGKTMADLGADVAASGGNWSDYRGALEEANRIIDENGALTEEQAISLFGSAEAAKITDAMFRDLRSEWDRHNDALKEAKRKHEEYARSMGTTTREAAALKKQQEVLNNEYSSTVQKAAAAKEVLDLINGSTRSFLGSLNTHEQALGSLGSAFSAVAEAGKGGVGAFQEYENALGKTSWRLDTTVSELAQLDSALSQSYDTALSHAQAVYDNAKAHDKNTTEAAAAANEVMALWRSSASEQLQQMGADAQQAESYLRDIAGEPWTVEVTFMGRAEDYMKAQAAVEKQGRVFDGKAFTAFLKANPDVASSAIEGMVKAGYNWSSSVFEASLLADGTDAQAVLNEVIERGRDFTDEERVAVLGGDNSAFLDAVVAAKVQGAEFDNAAWRAKVGLDAEEWYKISDKVLRDGEVLGSKTWVARMDLENPGFAEKFYAAEANLQGLTGQDWVAHVSSNVDEVRESQSKLLESLTAMNGTVSEVTVVSNAATEAAVLAAYDMLRQGMNGEEIRQALRLDSEEWNTIVNALPGNWEDKKTQVEQNPVIFNANSDPVAEKMAQVGSSLAQFSVEARGTATLDGDNTPFQEKKAAAEAEGQKHNAATYTATLAGNEAPFIGAKGSADGIGGLFNSSTFTAVLAGNSGPFSLAKGAMDILGGVFNSSTFTATLSGNNGPAARAVGQAQQGGEGWNRSTYTATLNARDNASGTISSLVNAARGFSGTFTATFRAVASKLGFADGGMVNGAGVQTFASGGFSENHQAMIARPSYPFRVWAEPETGGEAYIPLAASKRERSTRILSEVAHRFGYTINQYRDGGVTPAGGGVTGIDSEALGRAVALAIEPALSSIEAMNVPVQLVLNLDGRAVHSELQMLNLKYGAKF